MKDAKYQGYTNHATWVVNLWLTNTKSAYDTLEEILHDEVFFGTIDQKVEGLREYVTRNLIAQPLYKDGKEIQLDSRGENWALGIMQDFDKDDNIKDVNWQEIVESNLEA